MKQYEKRNNMNSSKKWTSQEVKTLTPVLRTAP